MSQRVIGYIRVSTSMQAESGLSIEAQRAKIEAYCVCHDLTLADVIVDAGESAKTLERPGIQTLLTQVEAGAVDGVVIAKLDRLTRSMRDLHRLLEQVFSKVQLHSVAESINTSSAAGRLVLNVLMSVAEWEREAIGERTSAALQAKKSRGEKIGKPRYGWRWEDGAWVEEPREQKVIELVKELRHRGYSYRAIKADLEERQILNRAGKAKWSLSNLFNLAAA
jgi:site-specific DNA recombinase